MHIGQRIKVLMKQRGLGTAAAAQHCGVTAGAVSNWFATGRISKENLLKIAALLGVSADALIAGEAGERGEALGPVPIPLDNNPDYPAIRRVRFKLSAGASGFGVDYESEDAAAPIVFQRQWFESRGYRPEKLLAIRVANGSMEPGLYHGDTVVVNTADAEPKDGEVFAVNYEGELVVKRLVRDAGQWWLSSDNPDKNRYPRKVCHEGVHLIGRIVHKQSERI